MMALITMESPADMSTESIRQEKINLLKTLAQSSSLGNIQDKAPEPNLLIIKIQPEEGVSMQFNAKEPGSQDKITPVFMDFCHQAPDLQNTPEAYEELLVALFKGEQSLFTHWKGVQNSWLYIDKLRNYIEDNQLEPEKYTPGSNGPVSSRELMARDGRCWWDEEEFDAST